jgi:hypothetical protein
MSDFNATPPPSFPQRVAAKIRVAGEVAATKTEVALSSNKVTANATAAKQIGQGATTLAQTAAEDTFTVSAKAGEVITKGTQGVKQAAKATYNAGQAARAWTEKALQREVAFFANQPSAIEQGLAQVTQQQLYSGDTQLALTPEQFTKADLAEINTRPAAGFYTGDSNRLAQAAQSKASQLEVRRNATAPIKALVEPITPSGITRRTRQAMQAAGEQPVVAKVTDFAQSKIIQPVKNAAEAEKLAATAARELAETAETNSSKIGNLILAEANPSTIAKRLGQLAQRLLK